MKSDIEIVCVGSKKSSGCGATFLWTVGEQEFIEKLHADGKIKSMTQPTRCSECRDKRKAQCAKKER